MSFLPAQSCSAKRSPATAKPSHRPRFPFVESSVKGKHVLHGRHALPAMTMSCQYCRALMFPAERGSSNLNDAKF